jgi:hypothetical protein
LFVARPHDPVGEPAPFARLGDTQFLQLIAVNTEVNRQSQQDFQDVCQLVRIV